jgi:hypothetical protein
MTLISAIPAKGGIVLCADSQETSGYYDQNGAYYELRKTVQKITPKAIGGYSIAIAGHGNPSLIESFIVRSHRAIEQETAEPTAKRLRDLLEDELSRFHLKDVVACPDQDKTFRVFIAFCCHATKEYGVWISENIVLRPVLAPELIGEVHDLYAGTVDRLFAMGMPIAQAVLTSLYVLTIGVETSNLIRDPLSVAIVRENGIWMEDANHIQESVSRLKEYEAWVNRVFLASSDTSISLKQLHETLANFSEAAIGLHEFHMRATVEAHISKGLIADDPYPKLPLGTTIDIPESGQIRYDSESESSENMP